MENHEKLRSLLTNYLVSLGALDIKLSPPNIDFGERNYLLFTLKSSTYAVDKNGVVFDRKSMLPNIESCCLTYDLKTSLRLPLKSSTVDYVLCKTPLVIDILVQNNLPFEETDSNITVYDWIYGGLLSRGLVDNDHIDRLRA